MTTNDGERPETADGAAPGARVLHVVAGYAGLHLVSPETLAAADAAQEEADASAADDSDEDSDDDLDGGVEDVYMHTIEMGMCDDVPADILDAFGAVRQPMFADGPIAFVERERLDEMVAALEARGFAVIRG